MYFVSKIVNADCDSGRHYERQLLSGILLKYRHRLAAELVSRCCARAGVAFDRHGTAQGSLLCVCTVT